MPANDMAEGKVSWRGRGRSARKAKVLWSEERLLESSGVFKRKAGCENPSRFNAYRWNCSDTWRFDGTFR
jgi:hypothetical protein